MMAQRKVVHPALKIVAVCGALVLFFLVLSWGQEHWDAYTVRIFHRCGLTPEHMGYDALQQLVHTHFAPDVHHYKELHGLIVWTGKDFCRKQPRCLGCPLALSQAQASCFPCCKPVKTAPIVR